MAKGNKTGGKRFPKGHKYAKGGKREGAGRLTKQQQEVKKLAAEMVRAYIEEHIKPVLESYFKLTQFRKVNHYDKDGNLLFTEEVIDAATVRHWIDKLVPAARQEIDIQTHGTVTVITNVNPHKSQKR